MLSCLQPLCNATLLDAKKLSQHKSRYHSVPILVVLPDGTECQVVNLPEGGYVCWCGKKFEIRESCTEHVQMVHNDGKKCKIFAKRKRQFCFITQVNSNSNLFYQTNNHNQQFQLHHLPFLSQTLQYHLRWFQPPSFINLIRRHMPLSSQKWITWFRTLSWMRFR